MPRGSTRSRGGRSWLARSKRRLTRCWADDDCRLAVGPTARPLDVFCNRTTEPPNVHMAATALPTLKPQDFASDQEVRWCPGCGDYSILAQMKKALSTLNFPREKMVFVSGIGCSSRFPYYMN